MATTSEYRSVAHLQKRKVKLKVRGGSVDVEPDHIPVDRPQHLQVLQAQLLLPGKLLLVHVLDQVTLCPAVHLQAKYIDQ